MIKIDSDCQKSTMHIFAQPDMLLHRGALPLDHWYAEQAFEFEISFVKARTSIFCIHISRIYKPFNMEIDVIPERRGESLMKNSRK